MARQSVVMMAVVASSLTLGAPTVASESGFSFDEPGLHLTLPIPPEVPAECKGEACAAVDKHAADVILDHHGVCRFIDTPAAESKVFVPSKTAEEFTSFVNADVEGVTKSTCCRPTTVTLQSRYTDDTAEIELPYARHGDTLKLFSDVDHPNKICSVIIETGEKVCEDFSWTEEIEQLYSCAGETWVAGAVDHSTPPPNISYMNLTGYGDMDDTAAVRAKAGFPVTADAPNAGVVSFHAYGAVCVQDDPKKYFSEEQMRRQLAWGMEIMPQRTHFSNAYCGRYLVYDNTHPKIKSSASLSPEHNAEAGAIWDQYPIFNPPVGHPSDQVVEDYMGSALGIPMTSENRLYLRQHWFHRVVRHKIEPYLAANRDTPVMTVELCDGGYNVYHNDEDLGPYDPSETYAEMARRYNIATHCRLKVE